MIEIVCVNAQCFLYSNFCKSKLGSVANNLRDFLKTSDQASKNLRPALPKPKNENGSTNRFSFEFVDPISILGSGKGTCKFLLTWSNVLGISRKKLAKERSFRLEIIISSCGYIVAASSNCKIGTSRLQKTCWKDFMLKKTSANSCYSMLGLKNVKNIVVKVTIYVCFVRNFLW